MHRRGQFGRLSEEQNFLAQRCHDAAVQRSGEQKFTDKKCLLLDILFTPLFR